MMQAPQIGSMVQGLSMGARARAVVVCVMACGALGWAQQSSDQAFVNESRHEIQDERARVMLRDALIKESQRAPRVTVVETIEVLPPSERQIERYEPGDARSLQEQVNLLQRERRERLKTRGEDVDDMHHHSELVRLTDLNDLVSPEKRCYRYIERKGRRVRPGYTCDYVTPKPLLK